MTAPPTVAKPGGAKPGDAPNLDKAEARRTDAGRPSVPGLDDEDPQGARPDLGESVVGIGEIPAIEAPVRPERRRLAGPPTDRLRGWITTIVLTLIGGLSRLWNVGSATDNGTPLFDEKYYAIQAAEVARNGGVEDNQAYGVVVHPPFGKQLIALGENLLGYTPAGWRIASVVAGTVVVLLTVRVVRRLTGSTLLGGIGGVLIICDGVSYVMARSALLDVFQQVFILAAFVCLIADRDQTRARLNASGFDSFLPPARKRALGAWGRWGDMAGIALGARWWRFACGVFMGLSLAIKYNGVYWIVAFGLLSVVWDITARREVGVRRPVVAALRRDVAPSLWSLVVIPFGVYIASWWAWLFSETAFPRHWLVGNATNLGDWHGSGVWYWLANRWQNSLWQWTWKMLDFHSTLVTPANPADRHPWESKPWTWPIGTRPVLFYVRDNQTGCGAGRSDCVERIFLLGTPALWWISLFVCAWALWRCVARMDWRYAAVLVGYGADYIPWFFNLNRQMYFFYVAPLAPFLIIGICLVLGDILGRPKVGVERRYLSMVVVAVYVGLVVANFLWLLPMLNGSPMTPEQLTMHTLLPSWG